MMRILYHLTILPPKMPGCEALSQEISALREELRGEVVYLNPNQTSPFYLPRLFFGLSKVGHLRRLEQTADIHHLYNPDPFPFPILRLLRRPVIYSISSGVSRQRPNLAFFSRLAAIAVADERSFGRLRGWGLKNVHLVRSGIDTHRFSYTPLPLRSEFRLMMGSAPWTEQQFRSKGVDALLEAAQQNSRLHLIFLWRGTLTEAMKGRVRAAGLERQVTIIDREVKVNQILAQVHASIALATEPGIIKVYPHSLLDSLAAGKPVLVSRAISMADYVEATGCGQVVETVDPAAILEAIETLTSRYQQRQKVALEVGQRDFSQKKMIASYRHLYHQVMGQPG